MVLSRQLASTEELAGTRGKAGMEIAAIDSCSYFSHSAACIKQDTQARESLYYPHDTSGVS